MTGATIIIKKGNDYIITKVRHSGYDTRDFFDQPNIFKTPFDKLSKRYHTWRKDTPVRVKDRVGPICRKFNLRDPGAVLSKYTVNGMQFKMPPMNATPNLLFDAADAVADQIWLDYEKRTGKEEGMFCGYGDYTWLIDYDNKKIHDLRDEELHDKKDEENVNDTTNPDNLWPIYNLKGKVK